MKIQCEGCGNLVEPTIQTTPAGVELVCPDCAHVALLGAPTPAPVAPAPAAPPPRQSRPATAEPPPPAPDPVEVVARRGGVHVERGEGEIRCPKCGFRQSDETACHRCGLVFAAGRGAQPWETPPPGLERQATELDRLWETIVASAFAERNAHSAFIAHARRHGLLERAARRYRFHAQDHPDDPTGREAEAQLARIVEMMHAEFVTREGGTARGDFERRVRTFKQALMIVAVIMCVGVLLLALYIFGPFR